MRESSSMDKEWFRSWFNSEEYLEVYQHRNEEDARKLLSLIIQNTSLKVNSLILDAACGAGRHLIDLTAKKFNAFGFDLSMNLLRKAKLDSKEKSIQLNVFCSDIRNVALKQKFDLILNLFTSFGYFYTDTENFLFVMNAFELLNDGGIYVLDYFNANYLIQNLVSESRKHFGCKTIIEKRKIADERVVKEIIICHNGSENSYFESVQLYSKEKIIDEFQKIGFKMQRVFGDYEGSKFDENNSPRLILFFRK